MQNLLQNGVQIKDIQLRTAPRSLYKRYRPDYVQDSVDEHGQMISIYGKNPIIKIQQSEIVFTTSDIRLVASSSAGPCIILAMRERNAAQGCMIHVFSYAEIMPELRGGSWLLQRFSEIYQGDIVDIYMIGGYSFFSEFMIYVLDRFVLELSNLVTIGTIFKQLKENWVSNVVLDFDSGEIYEYQKEFDESYAHSPNFAQGLLTSFVNILLIGRLWEVKPKQRKINPHLQEYHWSL